MDNEPKIDVTDQIDLQKIFGKLWKGKLAILISSIAMTSLGIFISFSIPKTFVSKVILAPEFSNGLPSNSNLSDIASMVGIDLNNTGGTVDAIYPEIYPNVVKSIPFITELFQIPISTMDNRVKEKAYAKYLLEDQKYPWWDKLSGYISGKFTDKKNKKDSLQTIINTFKLTKEQDDLYKMIIGKINCSVDKKNSLITINVEDQDPLVAALLADTIQSRLQEYITNYRTKKAKKDLLYVQNLISEAKKKYLKSQKKYADFSDANEDAVLQTIKSQRDEMENDMQLNYNMYTQLAQQLQAAKAKVQENTPAFTQIQPATVPLKKDGPKRMIITLAFAFLGFSFGCTYTLFRNRN